VKTGIQFFWGNFLDSGFHRNDKQAVKPAGQQKNNKILNPGIISEINGLKSIILGDN